jgi:hypothetical protein
MSQKQSKANKMYEQQMASAEKERNSLFAKSLEPTPELAQFRQQQGDWNKFIGGKDYSQAPNNSILNFDLWNPAQQQKITEKARNITGIGATALGGDNSIALQLARERNANELAQNQGNSYESAIKQQDAYFKGNALPYAQFDTSKNLSLLNNSTSLYQNASQGYADTAPKPFQWSSLLGGLIGAGSALLGNPALLAKR